MLKEGSMGKVLSEAENYLKTMVETEGLNAGMLLQFHHNFLQLIYHILIQTDDEHDAK
ncbi:hypothetical protein [Paenibacillus sp. MBLB4367]|uniref:hypothetical protein n=1 Tax=Paenibacillus sp. MBLB4367 TaxID=3384767 RepID=UPI0039083CD3